MSVNLLGVFLELICDIRHLAGSAMRLCVELGLHRKKSKTTSPKVLDPYQIELRKRLFWAAYCFDRSALSQKCKKSKL